MKRTSVVLTVALAGMWLANGPAAFAQRTSARANKHEGISLRLASTTPARGFEALTTAQGQTLYVAPATVLTGAHIASAESLGVRSGADVIISLSPQGASKLAGVLAKRTGNQMAVFSGGKMLIAGAFSLDQGNAELTLMGLSSASAQRLANVLNGAELTPVGTVISVAASQTTIMPGQTVNLDVFVGGVKGLRTYQLVLEVAGGSSGTLAPGDLWIDSSRPDYVFTGLEKLDGVDKVGHRIGSLLMNGSVDPPGTAYLGTFSLQATPDASGTFNVNVRGDRSVGLWQEEGRNIGFQIGLDAQISVGTGTRAVPGDK